MTYKTIILFTMLCAVSMPAMATDRQTNHQSFDTWLKAFRQEARSKGVSSKTLDDALGGMKPNERIIRLDRKQPEGSITLKRYLRNTVASLRIRQGRARLKTHHHLLQKISKEYGVQPRFIVALWGIETNYGANTGGFDVAPALATLAYDGRRSEFFRKELLNALKIIDQKHITADKMQGSWAGAMGQCQFMPSTFLDYAVDYNRNGRHNIWTEQGDVFASIANYLKSLGWRDDETWGRAVKIPRNFDQSQMDLKKTKSVSEWKRLGVRNVDGSALPDSNIEGSVVWVGDGKHAQSYLVYHNFKALLQWNRSRFFATAVGTLADRIRY